MAKAQFRGVAAGRFKTTDLTRGCVRSDECDGGALSGKASNR
jgi:hypothetical protein